MEFVESIDVDILNNGTYSKGRFDLFEEFLNCKIILDMEGRILESGSTDYFDALQQIRRILDSEKTFIQCNGARIDVYPSSMSRDMSQGLVAFILHMGQHGSMNDKVHVFDPSDVICDKTVEEQCSYHTKWLDSLVGA